jgi:hypothetical protein
VTQAECLRGLERADAIATAAQASILAGFMAGKGYADDADYGARSWLIHKRPTGTSTAWAPAWRGWQAKKTLTERARHAARARNSAHGHDV